MADLPAQPQRRLAIVTCMDCRIDPLTMAGLDVGEAHVMRNAGALVTDDVRRSLALSQRKLGTTEVWVVAHTGCGVLGLDDDAFLDEIEADVGSRPEWVPGGFASLEAAVRDGVDAIRDDPALSSEAVRGFVLNVGSGELTEVGAG